MASINLSLSVLSCLFLCLLCPASASGSAMDAQPMRDVRTLASADMAGRATGTKGSELARSYIIGRINALGLQACGTELIHEFSFTNRTAETIQGRNILACQPGSLSDHATAPSIVVSAHYDHLGMRSDKIYFGADDNASGVAGVLAIAEAMQKNPPQHDLIYVFFDAEEHQLNGSRAFAAKPLIDLKRVGLNMNFDMIARGDKGEIYASGSYHVPVLKTLLAPLGGNNGVKLVFGHDRPEQGQDDWTKQSDHYAFFKAGVPYIYFGVEDHPDYHQPTDTADKIKPEFFLGVIDLIVKASQTFDQALLTIDFRQKN